MSLRQASFVFERQVNINYYQLWQFIKSEQHVAGKNGSRPHFVAKCSILHFVLVRWGEGPGSDAPQVSSAWGPGPLSGDSNVRFLI